jgi:hypothetical protein
MHTQQVEDRRQVVAACAQIDDMYDSLAAHEQKARALLFAAAIFAPHRAARLPASPVPRPHPRL